jgi:hypothetical protein
LGPRRFRPNPIATMRIFLLCFGTRGDVLPLVALGFVFEGPRIAA